MPTPVITYRSSKTYPHADCFNSERTGINHTAGGVAISSLLLHTPPPARPGNKPIKSVDAAIHICKKSSCHPYARKSCKRRAEVLPHIKRFLCAAQLTLRVKSRLEHLTALYIVHRIHSALHLRRNARPETKGLNWCRALY